MPPKLIFIRHAEAEHNATQNWDLLDPPLTRKGFEQCQTLQKFLREEYPLACQIEHIITSPMRRTCQTTLLALEWLMQEKGVPVEVDAMWQENSLKPCDTGSSPATVLAPLFPTLNFSHLDPLYPSKPPSSPYAFTRHANRARGESCLRALAARKESVIAVVSHAGFLRTALTGKRFANADFRVFEMTKGAEGRWELVEDEGTEGRGGGMGRSERGVFGIREGDFPE